MGDLDVSSYAPLVAALPPIALSFAAFAVLPRRMNLLSISDESAASRGVDVHRTQRLAFLSASLATGAAVSLGGPVGFIGIVVPHLVRLHGRRRPSARPARVGVRRRGVSRRVRHCLANRSGAARDPGRGRHRHHRRTILFMAAHKKSLVGLAAGAVCASVRLRPAPDGADAPPAHHFDHPVRHRNAVCDGRGPARDRRRQLRPIPPGSIDAHEGRRPHRSRRRAHHLAEAGSRRHLRHAE